MKTPRELLLAHHQAAAPKLDALRREVVAGLGAATAQHQSGSAAGWLMLLWRELVCPCRRTWTALAAVWILLCIVNLAQRDGSPAGQAKSPSSVQMIMTYRNQERIVNELLADRSQPVEAERPKNFTPKPRSETGGLTAV
jgi:hypothetical protein